MKFRISLELKDTKSPNQTIMLDMDYNAAFLHLIKLGLSHTNLELFNKLYGDDKRTPKLFTTSIYFPQARFIDSKIILNNEGCVELYFSAADRTLAFNFYNAFAWLQNETAKARTHLAKPIKLGNHVVVNVTKITSIKDEPIRTTSQIFKTVSPIVVRTKNKRFISCTTKAETEEYNTALRELLIRKLPEEYHEALKSLKFTPIHTRMVIRKSFGINIRSTGGIFKLEGDTKLLNYLMQSGLGSRTGQFNGMILTL